MCIGVPCKITAIDPNQPTKATAEVNGIQRDVDISLVSSENEQSLVGQWVLVHVGFAMSLLDEEEAEQTLAALNAMQEEEPDVNILFRP